MSSQTNKTTRTTTRTTWTLNPEEVEKILREYVGAPATATVDLDCSFDGMFREATVTWEVVEESTND